MEWVTTTAKTLPEAIDLALDNLGVDEAEAEIVVLEEPSKGLFGRMRGSARVEARVKPRAIRPKNERGRTRRSRNNDGRSRGNNRGRGRSSQGNRGNRAEGDSESNREPGDRSNNDGSRNRKGQSQGQGKGQGQSKSRSNAQGQSQGRGKGQRQGQGRSSAATSGRRDPDSNRSNSGSGRSNNRAGQNSNNGGRSKGRSNSTSDERVTASAVATEGGAAGVEKGRGSDKPKGQSRGAGGRGRRHGNEQDRGSKAGKASGNDQRPNTNTQAKEETSVEEVAEHLRTFLGGLTDAFGLDGDVDIDNTEPDVLVATVQGQHGLMVGPKGRTLDAIQELARVSSQRAAPSNIRIRVDVGGYRPQRATALGDFASKAANKAVDNGCEIALEPMSPADRKSVHDSLAEDDRVETRSVGTEPRRRIIVIPVEGVVPGADEGE